MLKYVLRKLLQMLLVVFAVSALVFFTVRLSYSDPIASITKGKTVTPEVRAGLMERFHLDKPVPTQYFIWLKDALHGDFGESYQYRQSVTFLIGQRASGTLLLSAFACAIAVALSIPIGIACAMKAGSAIDKVFSVGALLFMATPTFITAILATIVFALHLKWFPAMGSTDLKGLVLPASAMALNMVALTSRITRSSMIEQLSSDYALAARAKGMPVRRVVLAHAFKNALVPVITIASLQIGGMLVGAVLVETVFAMGGLGDLLVSSVTASDYPVVQGVTMLMIVVFMGVNMLVDILYAAIDPRVRRQITAGA